ncbi:MAG: peptidoglycan DD-metalloendopeptidase family protein [Halieaceae bacterium]
MRALCLALMSLLLLACAETPRAPVEDRHGVSKTQTRAGSYTPSSYKVARGDTLYAIAWRYGMDFRALARANNIGRPYTIYPGQQLTLKISKVPVASSTTPAAAAPKHKIPAPAPVTKSSQTAAKTAVRAMPATPSAKVSAWRWPTRGKVVRGFSGTLHKGIDIDGKAGDAVTATAAGNVVYAGNGIVGYGELLIVKHNEIYLSAYGHNRKLLVAEGDSVKAGQKIAEKGNSATNSVKLHFEIRREGKPIDPKKLLPAR